MYLKRSGRNGGGDKPAIRSSNRVRRRPNAYGRTSFVYYKSPAVLRTKKSSSKTKTRRAACQIAKMLRPGNRPVRTPITSVATDLRRSSRMKKVSSSLRGYTDSSGSEDDDLMRPGYERSSRNHINNSVSQDGLTPKRRKTLETKSLPRREGLRPRRSRENPREPGNLESDGEPETSEDKADGDEAENEDEAYNGNNVEDDDDADDCEPEIEGEGDGEAEDEGEEDGDDDDEDDEQEGRRRYDLRNRSDARRHSLEESKQIPRSPRILHRGRGTKVSRDARKSGSRPHKRHRLTRAEDSDDSLLVDELDQGPAVPWGRGGSRSGAPLLFGGLDMHGTTAWGLNVAASGWGHQSEAFATLTSGIQTAGPSSKGGADIQPLQIDESVNFDEIGGLSEYIDVLKEMVFFPLLYPDFFASYSITPPRGVLLCGPPGTGKTLIARALACAASKAGQKVSFYMRKGADVLSKWVGEAERQLKLLFEEAQRNQPSIIFFDEIDGLAPVRSSKQEQIHNSIVSTLLALMDGLDSRGQVVLIGATNRVDAIDGALRRPGRFDREFNFPLPGCEARAEILDIHTRKWKESPSEELKSELAASCVGYCGADLKALCTEAAIRAFREKYPQVYTSDDKFVIDVDSVKVKKYHFVEAMSTITPAAHRGSIVHSRPLSIVVAPCLNRHLQEVMKFITDIFPVLGVSAEMTKLSMLSYGSAIPLVYRPRILLSGGEDFGLDHLGPAILHKMEKFPVHSLGLASLLSDPSAKTPEEALVHIFGEARRTTPSILYLPNFNLWWDNAHDQLKAVLRTLLEDLPSDSSILLLGTASDAFSNVADSFECVFSRRNVYELDHPSIEDRSLFFDRLIEAALSVSSDAMVNKTQKPDSIPELPKAPKVANSPKASELIAKVEAEQHALRRMRMCLRDVCNRILYDKRFSVFHYPVLDEDEPHYRSFVLNPMDVATLLQRVDCGQYITCSTFLQDVDLIVSNAKAYNGDDYNGARIVSRAHELRDAVQGMMSQMDPALVTLCDKIAAQGGPQNMPDGLGTSFFPATPVVQLGTVTRSSALLRNVQPEVNLDQSSVKRLKKNLDPVLPASTTEDKSELHERSLSKSPQEPEAMETSHETPETSSPNINPTEISSDSTDHHNSETKFREEDVMMMSDEEISTKGESVKQLLVEATDGYGVPQLERLYTRIIRGVLEVKNTDGGEYTKDLILKFLFKFAEDKAKF